MATHDEVLTSLGLTPSAPAVRRRVAECGTPSGYGRHLTRGEVPCDACTAANSEYKRRRYNAWKDPSALPPVDHGTTRGYRQHRYRRQQPCDACLAAYNAWYGPIRERRRALKRAARKAVA